MRSTYKPRFMLEILNFDKAQGKYAQTMPLHPPSPIVGLTA